MAAMRRKHRGIFLLVAASVCFWPVWLLLAQPNTTATNEQAREIVRDMDRNGWGPPPAHRTIGDLNPFALMAYILSGSAAAGAMVGGILLAWAKARFVRRSELFTESGEPRYQPRADYAQKKELYYEDAQPIYMHRTLCTKLVEQRIRDEREARASYMRAVKAISTTLSAMERRRTQAQGENLARAAATDKSIAKMQEQIAGIVESCGLRHGSQNLKNIAAAIAEEIRTNKPGEYEP